jgi:small subunit ribosomal protein S21
MKNNQNWKKNTKEKFNSKKGNKFEKKRSDDYSYFNGRSIEVRNDDVNGALRRLKKVLERMDFQKELAKREYYEKPSVKRKRLKEQAVKRSNKDISNRMAKGDFIPTTSDSQKSLKGKRTRRKLFLVREKIKKIRKNRHH